MKQYTVNITVRLTAEDIEEAGTLADEVCDIMVADNESVTDSYWTELAAAIGDQKGNFVH